MGAINSDGLEFLGDLGRRITQVADDIREFAFLFQRLSVLTQCYNAVTIQGTFAHTTSEAEYLFLTFVLNPRDLHYRGYKNNNNNNNTDLCSAVVSYDIGRYAFTI